MAVQSVTNSYENGEIVGTTTLNVPDEKKKIEEVKEKKEEKVDDATTKEKEFKTVANSLQPALLPHIQELMIILDAAQEKGVELTVDEWFTVSSALNYFAPTLDTGLSSLKVQFPGDAPPYALLCATLDKCSKKGAITRREAVQVFSRLFTVKNVLSQGSGTGVSQ